MRFESLPACFNENVEAANLNASGKEWSTTKLSKKIPRSEKEQEEKGYLRIEKIRK